MRALAACLALLPALLVAGPEGECYTVIAGRKTTADGSVLVAHNEDDSGDIVANLRRIAPRTYPGPVRTALNAGASFEAPARTLGHLWLEATTQDFADAFVNDAGVVLVSNSCPSREKEADLVEGGIGYLLRRLVAEQATSARDAVKLAGALIAKHGYSGSGRTYSFADRKEAWMLSVVKGRHWVAKRVPDDQVVVIPNHYILRDVDLADRENVLASEGLVAHAQRRGFQDPKAPFDFARSFRAEFKGELVKDGNTLRQWRGVEKLSGKAWKVDDAFPWSFHPGQPVTPEALMDLLRDHYEGTPYDLTEGHRKGTPNASGLRTICTRTTIHALVAQLRDGVPAPLATRLYLSLARPDTTVFVPFYASVRELPPGLGFGEGGHDYDRMWREHWLPSTAFPGRTGLIREAVVEVERAVDVDYGRLAPLVRRDLEGLERSLKADLVSLEQQVAAHPAAAQALVDLQAHRAFARLAEVTARVRAQLKAAPKAPDPSCKDKVCGFE